MCVVNLGRRIKGPIVAWKLLELDHGRLTGIQGFEYKIGKTYTSSPPGFQAFVNKEDAEQAQMAKWPYYVVRKVFLYNARKGVIENMDGFSDGKPGWAASKIRIPRKGAKAK